MEDWDAMFAAVTARLALIGQPQYQTSAAKTADERLALVRAAVLECVLALEQLHSTALQRLAKRDSAR